MKNNLALTIAVTLSLYGCGGSAFSAGIEDDAGPDTLPAATDPDSGRQPEATVDAGMGIDSSEVDSGQEADTGSPVDVDADAANPKMCCDILGTAVVQCDPGAPWFCIENDQSYSCTQPGKCMSETMCSVPAVAQSGVVQACP